MPETLASHIAAILSPSCSLSIQLPANDVGKVEEDGPSALVPATHRETLENASGCWIHPDPDSAIAAIGESILEMNRQMEDLNLFTL